MNRRSTTRITDYIIWWIVSLWLIIDSLNGLLISKSINVPISQIFKLGALAIITFQLSRKKKYCFLILCIILYITLYITHLAVNNHDISGSIIYLSKFISLVLFYCYFRLSFENYNNYAIHYGYKSLIIGIIVVGINISLGVLGYGIPSYGEENIDMGVKGFFFAGNELGGIMAVMAPFIFYIIINNCKKKTLYYSYLIVIIIGILIGTKTSIIATIASAIIVPLLYLPTNKRRKVLIIWIVIIVILSIAIKEIIIEMNIGAISRWMYFYEMGGFDRLIFSGRDEFWDIKSKYFYSSPFISQLLGTGADYGIVERDHLDTMIIYGYFGLVLIVSFIVYLLIYAIKHIRNNSLCKIVILSDIMILGIGYMAGHVWFSAMASIYVALLNAFVVIKKKGIIFSNKSITA